MKISPQPPFLFFPFLPTSLSVTTTKKSLTLTLVQKYIQFLAISNGINCLYSSLWKIEIFSNLSVFNLLCPMDIEYVDILTGKSRQYICLIYLFVRSSSRRGGDGVKGVYVWSIILLEYMKIWCNIQVFIYRVPLLI